MQAQPISLHRERSAAPAGRVRVQGRNPLTLSLSPPLKAYHYPHLAQGVVERGLPVTGGLVSTYEASACQLATWSAAARLSRAQPRGRRFESGSKSPEATKAPALHKAHSAAVRSIPTRKLAAAPPLREMWVMVSPIGKGEESRIGVRQCLYRSPQP